MDNPSFERAFQLADLESVGLSLRSRAGVLQPCYKQAAR
jgi:hypothetical protein